MESEYTPFSQRLGWNDVKPIELDEGENPVLPINLTFECNF